MKQRIQIGEAFKFGITSNEITNFYRDHWSRPISLSLLDFHDWQFMGCPKSNNVNHSVIALKDDNIVGVMGVSPSKFSLDSESLNGAELTTWVVAPPAQGQGVGKSILHHLQEKYDILAGAGITEAALPLYVSKNFTFLSNIPRFYFVSNVESLAKIITVTDKARLIIQKKQRPVKVNKSLSRSTAYALSGARSLLSNSHNLFVRDAETMAWRYDHHPIFVYESYFFEKGEATGTDAGVIFRRDCVEEVSFIHIVDLFGDRIGIEACVNFVQQEAISVGAAFVDFSSTNSLIAGVLRSLGWSSAVDERFLKLPHLFYPIEYNEPATTSLTVWAKSSKPRAYDLGACHITKGDLDLDRPTLMFYDKEKRKGNVND